MRAVLVLAAMVLAGCAQPAAQNVAPAQALPSVQIDADRPETSFGEIVTGPAVGPDLDATTASAPRLVQGEWWRIRFESSFFTQTPEFVRVVAAVEPGSDACRASSPQAGACGGYVVGMPHEGWFKEAIAYHAPAFGDVGLDLSYSLHNRRFEPLRFPLVQGATWETEFGASKVTATVENVDVSTATIRFDPPASEPQPTDAVFALLNPLDGDGTIRLVYDARQHEVVRFESMIGTWEVVEHGYDFEGWVTVPRGLHTAIDYGTFLPANPQGDPGVSREIEVSGGFNRLTLMHGVFAFAPGAYRIRDVAPNGTEFVTQSNGSRAFAVGFHEASDPDGAWKLEDVVAGAGGTYTMGMAYHQYDIRLPDGARRTDHSHPVIR